MKALGELGERDLCDLCVCWLEKGVELGELAELYKEKTMIKVEKVPPQIVSVSDTRPVLRILNI